MYRHLGNRAGIGLAGLALLAGGVYALDARGDRPGARIADLGFLTRHPWATPLAAGAAILIALAATRWLMAALGWGRYGSRTGAGIAMLGVAMKGVEGIGRIQVRVVRGRRLRMSLSLEPSSDLHEVIRRLDDTAVSRVRRAVDGGELPALVRLHVRRR
ncbi:hypothetical protein [Microbispora sp. ATCC PTA-5024]|uniref:hypothetical protein n=1 Tax=Microbispora sp. ATCC PTA-5024 TaxID=316330 RepID=UPI0003DC4572|nr:hypothetical protein [Microbispora sp. ATCC PTA-5024]ETK33925.1 hypothetical protein MPTA5024_22075 [Microbispora sp. ATCC PTA-5024]